MATTKDKYVALEFIGSKGILLIFPDVNHKGCEVETSDYS